MNIVYLGTQQNWVCPNCTVTAVTHDQPNRFHQCAGLHGLQAPLVLEGVDCKVEANEREDYIGVELVQTDGRGRPMMNVVTTRADGSNDCAVFAPSARVRADA